MDLKATANLAISRKYFTKRDSQLVMYCSGNSYNHADYNSTRSCDLGQVKNAKMTGEKKCITQNKLLVNQISLKTQKKNRNHH